jgi:hypothetical protein
MKKLFVISLFLNAGFLAVRCWQETRAHAQGDGAGLAATSGDTNGDESVDISDAIYLLDFLFSGGEPPVACAAPPLECPACDLSQAEVDLLRRFLPRLTVNAAGDITIQSARDLNLQAPTRLTLTAGSDLNATASGRLNLMGSGGINATSGDAVVVTGSRINLN